MTNPIANPGQFAAEADVRAMLANPRIAATLAQIEALFGRGYGDRIAAESRPLLGAFCAEYLNNWLFKAAASDAEHPRFVRDFMPAYVWHGQEVPGARTGGDNPDNCYRLAGIEHGTSYRVTGRILDRKAANISFTLTANYGTSQTMQTIEDHDMRFDADGRFEMIIDDGTGAGAANRLVTRPGVKFLFVRDSMMDWARETPLELAIERIGDARVDPIGIDEMVARATTQALGDLYLYFWFQNVWSGLTPNSITPAQSFRGAGGGLVTQGISNGSYRLGPDDAAIIEYDPAGASYAAVQLTEWLYRSRDYHRIQSSLTAAQSAIDGDGRIRLVIARRDPGVHTWLDTGGQEHVFSILRWQHMPADGPPLASSLHLTTIDRLKGELPADTRWVDADERAAQLAARLVAYGRRIV
jgi:hypothetical protein